MIFNADDRQVDLILEFNDDIEDNAEVDASLRGKTVQSFYILFNFWFIYYVTLCI